MTKMLSLRDPCVTRLYTHVPGGQMLRFKYYCLVVGVGGMKQIQLHAFMEFVLRK